jgi:hypothetical protein
VSESYILHDPNVISSATGGFVDQAGVALTNGGGTLVLGTHDSVSLASPNF